MPDATIIDHALGSVLYRMRGEVTNGDIESAHANADQLLVEALEVVGGDHPKVREIIEAYEAVGKWYA